MKRRPRLELGLKHISCDILPALGRGGGTNLLKTGGEHCADFADKTQNPRPAARPTFFTSLQTTPPMGLISAPGCRRNGSTPLSRNLTGSRADTRRASAQVRYV